MSDIPERIKEIKSVFEEYYGEDRVDLWEDLYNPEYSIIIWFPIATITNEYNKKTTVKDLYVKIMVNQLGRLIGTFGINKATYNDKEWISGYVHSHVPVLNSYREIPDISRFNQPCLGSGPIRGTCMLLIHTFDIDRWRLFAFELDKYIHTESVAGVPYIKLESIGKSGNRTTVNEIHTTYLDSRITNNLQRLIKQFIPYLISKRPFPFNYIEGHYGIGISPERALIIVSNLFIDFVNSLPPAEAVPAASLLGSHLNRYKFVNNKLFADTDNLISTRAQESKAELNGMTMFTFKDKLVTLNIIDGPNQEESADLRLIDRGIFGNIIYLLLLVINKKYETA